ncbi:hypothetical protein BOTBODRAFT_79596, partial [Botryobasidium botryosum FD-172 SS1]
PYENKYFLKQMTDTLPHTPDFGHHTVTITGNLTDSKGEFCMKTVDLWLRKPLDSIWEILQNPEYDGSTFYAPEKVF